MKLTVGFSLFIISLALYIFSPLSYSFSYCLIVVAVFAASSIFIIRGTVVDNNYFNFHILFLISFFFVNFVYPVVIYPSDPGYFQVFRRSFSHDIITKCSALALVGITSYGIGAFLVPFNKSSNTFPKPALKYPKKRLVSFLALTLVLISMAIIAFGGPSFLLGRFGSTSQIPPGLLVFFQVIAGVAIITTFHHDKGKLSLLQIFKSSNKIIVATIFLMILLFVNVGDRGPAIQMVIILIFGYSLYVKPIRLRHLAILIVLGMLSLTFISFARSRSGEGNLVQRGAANIQITSFVDLGMDLIVNNRNLYVGYEYANENGFEYGKGMFYYAFSPFPFVPSILTSLFFDSKPSELTTAKIIMDESEANYGLGTNMIADQYMQFGVLGVVFFMMLLGFVVGKSHYQTVKKNSLIPLIIYAFLIGYSIYLPRTTVLDPLRFLFWGVLIYIILKSISTIKWQTTINQNTTH